MNTLPEQDTRMSEFGLFRIRERSTSGIEMAQLEMPISGAM